MTKPSLHFWTVAAGTACLAALAALLWETEEPDCTEWFDGSPWDDADWPDDEPIEPTRCKVTAYDGGRTTIRPLVSAEYLSRGRS